MEKVKILGNDGKKYLISQGKFSSFERAGKITKNEEGVFVLDIFEEEKGISPSPKIFKRVREVLVKYLDTSNLNYDLLTTWILGTYFHDQFETYPLLTLMARKQSGKTRTLKLVSSLSKGSDGSVSTSITETFLFRHKEGSVFFDEMESISSKDKTALRETINSVYKKGNKIVRYKEVRKDGVKDYVEEEFHPYYPLGIANIYGFGDVLADRSLQLILQRSTKSQTRLIEDFNTNSEIISLRKTLSKLHAKIPQNFSSEWNEFIEGEKPRPGLENIFDSISKTELKGRPFEIFLPLFIVGEIFGMLPTLIKSSKEYMGQLEGDYVDNVDDLLQEFMDTSKYSGYVNLSQVLKDFRLSLENPEEWINSKWLGRAIKRLGLIKRKRIVNGCVQVELKINSTNTINPSNPTNTTNSTNNFPKEKVELVGLVEEIGVVDKSNNCHNCGHKGAEITDGSHWYCKKCAYEVLQ